MSLNLLEKTELWVNNIILYHANLTDLAATVADVLGLQRKMVLVVDVRPRNITFDILENDVSLQRIIGREKEILGALGALPGVNLCEDAYIHSNGILGLICADITEQETLMTSVANMTEEIKNNVMRRAIVYPTGFELQEGLIEDTNTPLIIEALTLNGYKTTAGKPVADDRDALAYELSDAVSRGFGLIITTGGVGAEDKDFTVESILDVDNDAATPYIIKFKRGTGRHVKDGVRIAVGTVGLSMLISLPGPNDEVRVALPILLTGLKEGWSKSRLAGHLAGALAEKWRKKVSTVHHHG